MVVSVGSVQGFAWVSIVVVGSAPTTSFLDLGFLPTAMGLYRWYDGKYSLSVTGLVLTSGKGPVIT